MSDDSATDQPNDALPVNSDQDEDSDNSLDRDFQEKLSSVRKSLSNNYQSSALAVADLFKNAGAKTNASIYEMYQRTAVSVCELYRTAATEIVHLSDLGNEYGYRKRTRELLSWAKTKGEYVSRSDLLELLSGIKCQGSSSSSLDDTDLENFSACTIESDSDSDSIQPPCKKGRFE